MSTLNQPFQIGKEAEGKGGLHTSCSMITHGLVCVLPPSPNPPGPAPNNPIVIVAPLVTTAELSNIDKSGDEWMCLCACSCLSVLQPCCYVLNRSIILTSWWNGIATGVLPACSLFCKQWKDIGSFMRHHVACSNEPA